MFSQKGFRPNKFKTDDIKLVMSKICYRFETGLYFAMLNFAIKNYASV